MSFNNIKHKISFEWLDSLPWENWEIENYPLLYKILIYYLSIYKIMTPIQKLRWFLPGISFAFILRLGLIIYSYHLKYQFFNLWGNFQFKYLGFWCLFFLSFPFHSKWIKTRGQKKDDFKISWAAFTWLSFLNPEIHNIKCFFENKSHSESMP